jgi:hypothetical protein
MYKSSILLFIIIFLTVSLTSCGPTVISFYNVIHLARIDTILKDDGSGRNIFWLVVPADVNCQLVNLMPALEGLDSSANLSVTSISNDQYKGYQVVYEFANTDQIPAQIEKLQTAVVDAVIATISTQPSPETTQTSQPLPAVPASEYYNPNDFSIAVSMPSKNITGQKWGVKVIVNPFLMTGMPNEDLTKNCNIQNFTYNLTVADTMKITKFNVDVPSYLAPYSRVTQTNSNSIQWVVESEAAFDTAMAEYKTQSLMTPPPVKETGLVEITSIYSGKGIYTLDVTATTPNALFFYLTSVVAPILGLIALTLGLFVTLKNLFDKRK